MNTSRDDVDDVSIPRDEYARRYGPTTGDRIRLADTNLLIEVERDFAVYGDEITTGYGEAEKDSITATEDTCDIVLVNTVIVDWYGVIKADIGIKDGKICGIGKAGNPHLHYGVSPDLIIGNSTQVIDLKGKIITAGAVDCYASVLNHNTVDEYLNMGITTVAACGVGTVAGESSGTNSFGVSQLNNGLQLLDNLPINILLNGKGAGVSEDNIRLLFEDSGAAGLFLNETWGAYPDVIDYLLSAVDRYQVPLLLKTDSANSEGFIEHTIAAFKNRTVMAVGVSGIGGGHLDAISMVGQPNVIPVSIASSLILTENSVSELKDLLMYEFYAYDSAAKTGLIDSLAHPETMMAEAILHDKGAIPIIASGHSAPGRINDMIKKTWQLAHVMKEQRGSLPEDTQSNDNIRVRRYISKYTINPARALGIDEYVGSIEVGKLANLVVWDPAFFGVTPDTVFVNGTIAQEYISNARNALNILQPLRRRRSSRGNGVTFVSPTALENKINEKLGCYNRFIPIKPSHRDMMLNDYFPSITVDPETYVVIADGETLKMSPVTDALPLEALYSNT